jgi:hypothetical protein
MFTKTRWVWCVLAILAAGISPAGAEEAPLDKGRPAPVAPAGQVGSGGILELQIGSSIVVAGSNGQVQEMPQGRLFAGAKMGGFILGLGFELTRVGYSQGSGFGSSSNSATAIMVAPGIRFDLARSDDQRAELFGEIDVGIGHTFFDSSSGSGVSNYRIVYQAGPGLRYWIHPQFGVGGAVGVRGDHSFYGDGPSNSSYSVTNIFTSLHILGVF